MPLSKDIAGRTENLHSVEQRQRTRGERLQTVCHAQRTLYAALWCLELTMHVLDMSSYDRQNFHPQKQADSAGICQFGQDNQVAFLPNAQQQSL
jgi:hypothetical protein